MLKLTCFHLPDIHSAVKTTHNHKVIQRTPSNALQNIFIHLSFIWNTYMGPEPYNILHYVQLQNPEIFPIIQRRFIHMQCIIAYLIY